MEEIALAAFGDADATVNHGKAQPLSAFLLRDGHLDLHAAMFGKLDGIAQEIEQYLAQLAKIAA